MCTPDVCAHVHLCADVVVLGQPDDGQGGDAGRVRSFPLNSAGESGSFKMELPWEEVQASSWALVLTLPDQCLVLRGSWGPQDRGVEGRSSRGLSRGQALRPSLRLQDDKPKRLWAPP